MIGGFHRGIEGAGLVEVSCKRCAGAAFVKNGTVRGHQGYLCKACGCNFTATPERGKPEAMKALAVRGSQASIDRSSAIPRSSAKRAKSAIEASTMRTALETTQVRRRNRASQCRWRGWARSLPWGP